MKSLLLFLYILAAFTLSAWLLQFAYFIGDDGAYYARVAGNLMAGKGITFNPGEAYLIHPPLYPLMIGLFNLLIRNLELSAHLVSIAAFSLTVIPLFLFAESAYSRNVAHWTCLLYFTNGFVLAHSNLVMADTLFVLLAMTELYLVHQSIQAKNIEPLSGILIGWIAGIAYLTRPEGLVLYLVCVLALLVLASASWTSRSRVILVSFLAFLFFYLPYMRFVHQTTHRFQMSRGVMEIFIKREMDIFSPEPEKYLEVKKIREGLTDDKTRLRMDEFVENFNLPRILAKDRFKLIRSATGSALWRFLELNQYLFGGLGFLLIGASWCGVSWTERRKKSEYLLLFFLSSFSLKLLGQFLPRYFFHYFPILLLWMGNGLETFRNWGCASFRWDSRRSVGFVLVICFFLAIPSAWYLKRVLMDYPMPFEYKELGLWMKQNLPEVESESILSRQPSVSFYSEGRIRKLPYVDRIEDLLTYMNHVGAKYFVVADDLDRPFLDTYRPLLDEAKPAPPGLTRVHTVKGVRKLILYQVNG